MKLFDASDLRDVQYGCTEYAVKRLTGRDLYVETGLSPERMGFENVETLTGNQCNIHLGTARDLATGKLNGTMLRILPSGQEDLHTVIVIDGTKKSPVIEDQHSRRAVPATDILAEWKAAGQRYARCSVRR